MREAKLFIEHQKLNEKIQPKETILYQNNNSQLILIDSKLLLKKKKNTIYTDSK